MCLTRYNSFLLWFIEWRLLARGMPPFISASSLSIKISKSQDPRLRPVKQYPLSFFIGSIEPTFRAKPWYFVIYFSCRVCFIARCFNFARTKHKHKKQFEKIRKAVSYPLKGNHLAKEFSVPSLIDKRGLLDIDSGQLFSEKDEEKQRTKGSDSS